MTTLKEVKDKLRDLGLGPAYGYRREIRLIPETLRQNEQLRAITSGLYDGQRWYLLACGERLYFLAKPRMGQPQSIVIERVDIRSVKARKSVIFATITIETKRATYKFSNVLKKSLPSFLQEMNDNTSSTKTTE